MNWAEEKFVKVFTRDTPTWLAWPWQARAVAPLLMRKLEADGRLAVGRLEPTRAVALVIGLPEEVVEIGLAAMLDDGTVELAEDGLRWPRFEEAQESRKTEALRSREYRARQRTESSTPTRHTPSHAVTPRHTPSPSRTEQNRTEQINNVLMEVQSTPPPSTREVFEYWRKATGKSRAVLDTKRRDLIGRRLAEGSTVEDLKAAIDGYAKSPWHNGENDRKRKFLGIELMLRDAAHVEAGMDMCTSVGAIAPKSRVLTGSDDPYTDPTETTNG